MSLRGLFVVGTDTGVGKTRVASAIARQLVDEGRRVGVLKPMATGPAIGGDAERLIEAIGVEVPADRVAPITFDEPLAPAVAARRAGKLLDRAEVLDAVADALGWWNERAEVMVVEGVGGLLCPLAEGMTVADLAIALDYPLVIVARRGLGTLNHTLLTVEAALIRGLRVAGVVLNGAEPTADPLAEATNPGALAEFLPGVAVLAEWPHGEGPSALGVIDWWGHASPPRGMGVFADAP